MRLWLVRHAATAVPAGICCGRWDVPADARATEQAAHALHAVLPQAAAWWVSPQQRAQQLAKALARQRRLPAPAVDARLAEFDFGYWEGRTWDSIPRAQLDAWAADFARYAVGGAESVRALLHRVRSALRDTLRCAADGDAVWITHAGVIRAVCYTIDQGWHTLPARSEDWPATAPACGACCQVDIDPPSGADA